MLIAVFPFIMTLAMLVAAAIIGFREEERRWEPRANQWGDARQPFGIQRPIAHGTVARYTFALGGDVNGLLLIDGTEVRLPRKLLASVVRAVKPGDTVTVKGVCPPIGPMIAAAVINDDPSYSMSLGTRL